MNRLLPLGLCLVAASVFAQDAKASREASLAAYRAGCEAMKSKELARLEMVVAEAKQAVVEARKNRNKDQVKNIKDAEARIKAAQARIKEVEAGTVTIEPVLGIPLAVGAIGRIDGSTAFKVVQVVDKQNAIIDIIWVKYERVARGNRVVEERKLYDTPAWFKVPTEGMVDDRGTKLAGLFQVTGTKTYDTANGATKTVFVVEPFKP